MLKNLIVLLFFYTSIYAQKNMHFDDFTYEKNIKTVLLYPSNGQSNLARGLQVPVIELGEELTLEFDDLSLRYDQFHVKVIHCDINWNPSKVNDIDFVSDFNDEIINNYAISQSTKVSYYHYEVLIPKVKISGNYLAVVWRDRDKSDLILTKRFIVVENKVGILPSIKLATDPQFRKTKQQIEFTINYGNLPLMSPKEDLKVVIKQNFRWNKTLIGLKPFNVIEGQKTLEYKYFDNENLIDAGNEYRFFDIRSTFRKGFGVDKIEMGDVDDIWLYTQKNSNLYTNLDAIDQNGLFSPQNLESRNTTIEPDYPFVTFTLKSEELESKKIYVNGAFNNWQFDESNLMEYDSDFKGYVATIQLKQGIYNYNFIVEENGKYDETFFEGNFAETENIYEIIIYTKPQAGRTDRIVGYKAIQFNQKR